MSSHSNSHGSMRVRLLDLPNEIMLHVLYNFATLPLLHMRSVNHRFSNLILHILHGRLLLAASLGDRRLILECYHPSTQYSEPFRFCDYLGTPGLSDRVPGQGAIFDFSHSNGAGMLRKLYSAFRPTLKDPQNSTPTPGLGGETTPAKASDDAGSTENAQEESQPVRRVVTLDANENFSQLVFNTDLVQLGPRRGMFLDILCVNEKKTLRIFREWLEQRTKTRKDAETGSNPEIAQDAQSEHQLIWIDEPKRTAGLRVVVEEFHWRSDTPVLVHRDDDQAVNYVLELQELQISTIHLLLAIENNILQQERYEGKAMIFTTFRPPS